MGCGALPLQQCCGHFPTRVPSCLVQQEAGASGWFGSAGALPALPWPSTGASASKLQAEVDSACLLSHLYSRGLSQPAPYGHPALLRGRFASIMFAEETQ